MDGVPRGWRASVAGGYALRSVEALHPRVNVHSRRYDRVSPPAVVPGVLPTLPGSMKTLRAPLIFVLALLVAVLLAPTVALAHGKLRSSSPSANSRLSAVPTEVRLTFTEATELAFTRIELFGPGSQAVGLGPVAFADGDARRVVVAAVQGTFVDGTYTVAWQMVGADGHPVRGRFTFMIMPGASGLADAGAADPVAVDPATGATTPLPGEAGVGVAAPGQTSPPAAHHDAAAIRDGTGFDAESPLYVAIRWLTLTALVVTLGAVAFHLFVLGFLRRAQGPDSPMLAAASARAATLAARAAGLLGVAALLRLYAQSYALHGTESALDPTLIATMLSRTTWGWGWVLQTVGVTLALIGFLATRPGRQSGWALATLATAALAFTPALSGHAAAVPRLTPLAILADGLHVIGAGGWLGGLLFVVAVGIPAARCLPEGARGRGVRDLINAFSPTALVFAGIVATTGVFSAWLHLEAVSELWRSGYGRMLLLKLGVLSIAVATGAYNWLRVKPALGNSAGAARIRRSSTVELAAGVVVLIITAVLVATPTPMDAALTDATATQRAEGATPQLAPAEAGDR